ncbi:MAG: hypothetical protein ACE5H3_08665, partial [Planctomycetota bacterium]
TAVGAHVVVRGVRVQVAELGRVAVVAGVDRGRGLGQAEQVEQLRGRGREGEAIATLDGFVQRARGLQEKEAEARDQLDLKEGRASDLKKELKGLQKGQQRLADLVGLAFSRKRVTEPHMRLWRAAVYAWGQMGPYGSKGLWKVFGDKRFNKDVEFRALVVKQIGETRDYSQASKMIDMLDSKDEIVIAATGEALAQWGEVRRKIVGRAVVILDADYNAATNINDTTANRIYRTIHEPLIRALSALTGQSFRDPLDWTRWWNKNKKNPEAWKDPS